MKVLIVEDDFTSRALMQHLLAPYGDSHIAVDGQEAVDAFRAAWEQDAPYDLICLDIMMPRMDGHEVLMEIRSFEEKKDIPREKGVKIIMTTALFDGQNVLQSFKEQCDAYMAKPIEKNELIHKLEYLGLLDEKK